MHVLWVHFDSWRHTRRRTNSLGQAFSLGAHLCNRISAVSYDLYIRYLVLNKGASIIPGCAFVLYQHWVTTCTYANLSGINTLNRTRLLFILRQHTAHAKWTNLVKICLQNDLPNAAFPIIEDLRKRQMLCDVTIRVGDFSYKAHKVVLAAAIPYFHAMFTSNMAESEQVRSRMF